MTHTKHLTCIACQSDHIESLSARYPQDLVRCADCGLHYFESIPSDVELTAHYSHYPVIHQVPEITITRYQQILSKLEPFKKTGKILDIGCGEGFFLQEALCNGWEAHGTEFADMYIPLCESKGIRMQQGQLDVRKYPEGSFDVITWFEVIEHINYPMVELANIHKLLRPGGMVYVTTPNFNSLSRYLLKGNWSMIEYPGHLAYYSPKSLTKLFNDNGFTLEALTTTGISPGRLRDSIQGSQGSKEDFHAVDKRWQAKMENNIGMVLLKSTINTLLNLTKKGDAMKAYFIKK